MELVRLFGEIVLDDSFPADSRGALFGQLAPRIGAGVIERSRIERVGRDRPIYVIMSERDIIPTLGAELCLGDLHGRAIELAAILRQHAFDLTMQEKDVVLRVRIGLECRSTGSQVGNRENRKVMLGKWNSLRFALHNRNSERRE